MTSPASLLKSIGASTTGLTLSDLLARYPGVARRSAQRWLGQLVEQGRIAPQGAARARRYVAIKAYMAASPPPPAYRQDSFPGSVPLSPDSRDILAYVDRPLHARKPVGYQEDFLASYRPNKTWYLPEPLRRQLRRMGDTGHSNLPAGTYGRAILDRLLIDLSWASSHLEGNTYTRLDTRELIERGKAARGKARIETQMILNHKAAIEFLAGNVHESTQPMGFNHYTLFNLHAALSQFLLPNPANEGGLRQHAVEIAQSVYRPLSAPPRIDALFDQLLDKAGRIIDPFEQSFFVMVHLPYLQPFADVNKRTARLAANLPLLRANLCPLTFLDVPEAAYSRAMLGVYEMTRVELLRDLYVWAYERSTGEYLTIKQDLVAPDPQRQAHSSLIKQTIHDVVTRPDEDPLTIIRATVQKRVPAAARETARALIIEELRRLHTGVLARYGLRPSEMRAWQARQAGLTRL